MPSYKLKILNEKGLHARASATAEIAKDGLSASGDSIMGLLMLAAPIGTTIEVLTSGPEAAALGDAIGQLVADKFGEEC